MLGGAGTGKTVVAMHTARFLAQQPGFLGPGQKLLFTTFTRNLAEDRSHSFDLLCGAERDKIEVRNLHAVASDLLARRGVKPKIPTPRSKSQGTTTNSRRLALSIGREPSCWPWQNVRPKAGGATRLFPAWERGILTLACVRIIAVKTLRDFWARHPRAEVPLREWYAFVARARWRSTSDIKRDFASASFVGKNRVVFNIGGNRYRLVVVSLLAIGTLYVRFVGTHAKYDKIDVTKV